MLQTIPQASKLHDYGGLCNCAFTSAGAQDCHVCVQPETDLCHHVGVQGSLQYRGPVDVVRQVMKGEGGMVGLYKGLLPTMVREVAGCSAMFAAYEAIKLGVVKQQVPASTLCRYVPQVITRKGCNVHDTLFLHSRA